MLYFSDENGNLIPVATDNQGNTELKMDLIWENPNKNTSFASQSISINNISNYKLILIDFKLEATGGDSYWSGTCKQGSSSSVVYWNVPWDNVFSRMFYTNDSGITFDDTKRLADKSTNNGILIPAYVYGIK